MFYYARFEIVQGQLFRFDTRVYLNKRDAGIEDKCVGAIVGKNPGSAQPTKIGVFAPLDLDGDKMLPTVRNRFISAYQKAGKPIPENAFVQVWNLFYLCNPNLCEACEIIKRFTNQPKCLTEKNSPKIVWFAWGGENDLLNTFKQRFILSNLPGFYYNHRTKTVIGITPSVQDFAKHPQGMPGFPVIDYIADAL